jgi:hypothetical protein
MPIDAESDLLFGTRAIAGWLGLTGRQPRRRIEADLIPAFHLGGILCARKSTLQAWLAALEAEGVVARAAQAAA